MHDCDTYEACMAMEIAIKRVENKLATLRDEVVTDFTTIWCGIRTVTSYDIASLNEAIRRSALELDIIL